MNKPRICVGLGLVGLLALFAGLLAASTSSPAGYGPWRPAAFLTSLAAATAFAGYLLPRDRFPRLGIASRIAGWPASLPSLLDLFIVLFWGKLIFRHSELLSRISSLSYLLASPGHNVALWVGIDTCFYCSHLTLSGYVRGWLLVTALNWLLWCCLVLVARLSFEKLFGSTTAPRSTPLGAKTPHSMQTSDAEMLPPIIVDENGDVSLFRTAADAERCLEPIDVKNEEYMAYDSVGHRLTLEVVRTKREFLGGLWMSAMEAVVLRTEGAEDASEEVRQILVGFLGRLGESSNSLENAPLRVLVDRAIERVGLTT